MAAGKPLDEARAPQYLLDKHYMRKHGPNAYYGQKKN
jgi:L-ribulose-5-phosphate 4-epimerase